MSLASRFTGAAAALVLVPALALAQAPKSPAQHSPLKSPPAEGPLKHSPKPTTAAITAADLMTRLYVFADDSMLGREAGTLGGVKGTDYIARELKRLGLEPAGDGGTYFQNVPLTRRQLAKTTTVAIEGGDSLVLRTDFLPIAPGQYTPGFGAVRSLDGVQVVYAGALNDPAALQVDPATVAGKLVVFDGPRIPSGERAFQFWAPQFAAVYEKYAGAAGLAIATLDVTPATILGFFGSEPLSMGAPQPLPTDKPVAMLVTASVADKLMGAPLAGLKAGAAGRTVRGSVGFSDAPTEHPARNVVAVVRGSDAKLRNSYVVVGSHNDHDGLTHGAVDHDSLRVFNRYVRPGGAESQARPATAEELVKLRVSLDSIRALRAARADTVMNGADDDGSGSMGMLEIAEQLAAAKVKPKRSVLFVWHTAEEKGLYGSAWYSDHPTVPRDSIVAGINIDMIGRGGAFDDVPNGGMNYVQLIGSRRLSTQLGDLVEKVSRDRKYDFAFDYQFDANGHPAQYYCRSDHYNYARYGIPVVFLSTGGHQDYHMASDEPQYIDYPHFARVTSYIGDLTATIANLPTRPVVDKPKPDPKGNCVQ